MLRNNADAHISSLGYLRRLGIICATLRRARSIQPKFPEISVQTQWIGSVQPEKCRKNWSTFWDGPLFPVGPVWILVECWMDRTPRYSFYRQWTSSQSEFAGKQQPRFQYQAPRSLTVNTRHHTEHLCDGALCSMKLALKSRFWNRSWTEHLHEADSTEEKQTFIDGEWNLTFIL